MMAASGRNEARRQRALRPRAGRARHVDRDANPVDRRTNPGLDTAGGDTRAEVLVADDPALRAYLRAPYDPVYGIRATSAGGPRRIGALVVTLLMALRSIIGLVLTVRAVVLRDGPWVVNGLWSALFAFVFGVFALALARRLRSARRAS